jgi:hypothetical protein
MTLDPGSRYAGLPIIEVPARDGTVRRLGAPRVAPAPRLRGSFEVPPGARLDLLAREAAGDSTRWWLLADANPWADAAKLERSGQIVDLPDG